MKLFTFNKWLGRHLMLYTSSLFQLQTCFCLLEIVRWVCPWSHWLLWKMQGRYYTLMVWHTYHSKELSGFNIFYGLVIIRNSSPIGLIAISVVQIYWILSNGKVMFHTFCSINACSFAFCCEPELPTNLADLAEAAFGERYSKWNCWVLLSVRKHFANILVFTRLWRFLNTHVNVCLMIPVSVFSSTLKFVHLQSNTEKCSAASHQTG